MKNEKDAEGVLFIHLILKSFLQEQDKIAPKLYRRNRDHKCTYCLTEPSVPRIRKPVGKLYIQYQKAYQSDACKYRHGVAEENKPWV